MVMPSLNYKEAKYLCYVLRILKRTSFLLLFATKYLGTLHYQNATVSII